VRNEQQQEMSYIEIESVMERTLLSPLAVGDPATLSPRDKLFVGYPSNRWWVVKRKGEAWVVRYRNREYQTWEFDDSEFWSHRVFLQKHEDEYRVRKAVIHDRMDRIRNRRGFDLEDFVFKVPFAFDPNRETLDGSELFKEYYEKRRTGEL
jgi:hypothetical protein